MSKQQARNLPDSIPTSKPVLPADFQAKTPIPAFLDKPARSARGATPEGASSTIRMQNAMCAETGESNPLRAHDKLMAAWLEKQGAKPQIETAEAKAAQK